MKLVNNLRWIKSVIGLKLLGQSKKIEIIIARKKVILYTVVYKGITFHYKTVIMGCGKSDEQIRKEIREEMACLDKKKRNKIKEEKSKLIYNKKLKVMRANKRGHLGKNHIFILNNINITWGKHENREHIGITGYTMDLIDIILENKGE